MNKFENKIGLGTAQWGMQYGVSNTGGQTSSEEINRILEVAQCAGISCRYAPVYAMRSKL